MQLFVGYNVFGLYTPPSHSPLTPLAVFLVICGAWRRLNVRNRDRTFISYVCGCNVLDNNNNILYNVYNVSVRCISRTIPETRRGFTFCNSVVYYSLPVRATAVPVPARLIMIREGRRRQTAVLYYNITTTTTPRLRSVRIELIAIVPSI